MEVALMIGGRVILDAKVIMYVFNQWSLSIWTLPDVSGVSGQSSVR